MRHDQRCGVSCAPEPAQSAGSADRRNEVAPVDTQRVWLTEDAFNRMKVELANLLVERSGYGIGNGELAAGEPQGRDVDDGAVMADWQHRELRIRQLMELIRSAVVLEPPDDGVAEPGMVLTVRYDGDDSTETFLMVDRQEAAQAGLAVCSLRSPLGRALAGAAQGEERRYRVPDGSTVKVTLVRAVPFRCR
jgi:transcription elongation factor GreA